MSGTPDGGSGLFALRLLVLGVLAGVFCYQCKRSFDNLLDPGVVTEQSEEYATKVNRLVA